MNQQALDRQKPRRNKYSHKKGKFVLTASFKDTEINRALINFVGRNVNSHTQAQIASVLGCSTSTIGKMVRIYYFNK